MERTIRISEGKIIGRASRASEGYTLIYDNTTRGGMSGGPILNTDGEIIGIHGKGDLKDGSKENYGIPIEKFYEARGSSFGKRRSPPKRTDDEDDSILLGGLAILGGGAGLLSLGYLFGSHAQGKREYFVEILRNSGILKKGIMLEMVSIPGGSFLMGSPESEEGRWDRESRVGTGAAGS